MSKADGKTPVNLLKCFNATTLDVIASVAFSMNLDTVNNPENEFNKNITKSLSGLIQFIFDPLIKFKPNKWSFIRESKKVFRYLRDIGRKALISRLNAMKNGEYLPNDILQTILEANSKKFKIKLFKKMSLNYVLNAEDDEIDIEKMVDDFVTFFIAGQETTASALAFIFMELGRNPDILQKYLISILAWLQNS
jgi:cholesterol 24(S)-hydroxylase